jgi:hypothetical protein
MAGVDLTTIEGIAEGTALVILSEIGTDMHRWPSVKHYAVCTTRRVPLVPFSGVCRHGLGPRKPSPFNMVIVAQ